MLFAFLDTGCPARCFMDSTLQPIENLVVHSSSTKTNWKRHWNSAISIPATWRQQQLIFLFGTLCYKRLNHLDRKRARQRMARSGQAGCCSSNTTPSWSSPHMPGSVVSESDCIVPSSGLIAKKKDYWQPHPSTRKICHRRHGLTVKNVCMRLCVCVCGS